MKKHLTIALCFAAAVLCGCQQSEEDQWADAMTFTGVIDEGDGVRTYLSQDGEVYHVFWKAGDRIAISGNGKHAIYEATDGGSASTLFKMADGDMLAKGPYTAYYPESAEVSFPSVQEYAEGTASCIPMMAVSDSETLTFKNLGAIIKLNVKSSAAIKSLYLSADQPLSGKYTVVDNAAVVSEGSGVAVTCGDGLAASGTAVPVFVSVPAGAYTNMTVKAFSTDGKQSVAKVRGDGNLTAQRSKWHEADVEFTTFTEGGQFDNLAAKMEATPYGDGKWAEGDSVVFYEAGQAGKTFKLGPSFPDSENGLVLDVNTAGGCAVWPAASGSAQPASASEIFVTIPEVQRYVAGGMAREAMVKVAATAADGSLLFKNILGIVEVKIDGITDIEEVRLTSLAAEALWGEALVNVSADDPTPAFTSKSGDYRTLILKKLSSAAASSNDGNEWFVTGGSATVTDGKFGDETVAGDANVFRFAVPAGSLSQGFRITAIDSRHGFMQKEFKAVTIKRNTITDAGTVQYVDQSVAEGRTDVPNKAYYKDIFMDSGISLTQNPTMPIEKYLNLKLEHVLANDYTQGWQRQQDLFVGTDSDLNGVLLYPDGAPRFRSMYVSGGGSNDHGVSLGSNGREAVRKFYNNGGSYMGSCAGAYLATHGVYNYSTSYSEGFFGLWPGIVYRTSTANVYLSQDIPTDSPLLKYYDFGGDYHVDSVRHHNGPYFGEYYLVPGTEVLSRFNARSYDFDGEAGVIAYKENPFKGRVIAIGSHPEQVEYGENLEFMAAIAKYALDGFGVARVKAVLRNGQTRTMDKGTNDNDPDYTMIGDLQCHHFIFVLPEDAKDINITMSTTSKFNLSLRLAKDTYAFKEDAQYKVENTSALKTLHFDTLPAGTWYIGVQCEDTVTATKNTNRYDYTNTDVLNGVPYSISVNWK